MSKFSEKFSLWSSPHAHTHTRSSENRVNKMNANPVRERRRQRT